MASSPAPMDPWIVHLIATREGVYPRQAAFSELAPLWLLPFLSMHARLCTGIRIAVDHPNKVVTISGLRSMHSRSVLRILF